MSTPLGKAKLPIDRPCSACSDGDSEMEYHDHNPPFREGVAAPLEPSPPYDELRKSIYILWKNSRDKFGQAGMQQVLRDLIIEWAAAVSKNLQQSVEQLCGDLKAIQKDYTNEKKRAENLQEELARERENSKKWARFWDESQLEIAELEKEITALRIAQSAVTGTESHWRGRDAALRETK